MIEFLSGRNKYQICVEFDNPCLNTFSTKNTKNDHAANIYGEIKQTLIL